MPPTRSQVQAALTRIRNLAEATRSDLNPPQATMGQSIWVGESARQFEAQLQAKKTRLQQALDRAVQDAGTLLANTPADQPPAATPAGTPGGRARAE